MLSLLMRLLVFSLFGLGSIAPRPTMAASGELVLYTSQLPDDAANTVEAFQKHHPDVKVSWVRNGTSKLIANLRKELEAGVPKPDVILIADSMNMEWLKQRGHLWAYEDAAVDGFPAHFIDPDRTYFGTKYLATLIAYNTSAARPTSWLDLLGDDAAGQVIMADPRYSGAATIHLGTLSVDPALGWQLFEALAENGTVSVPGNGNAIKSVVRGDKRYAIVLDYIARKYKQAGAPIDYVFPAEGVSVATAPVAILDKARNKDAARAFVDFVLSDEGQQLVSNQGMVPAKTGISPPAGVASFDDIKVLPSDIPSILAIDRQNKARFAELFGG